MNTAKGWGESHSHTATPSRDDAAAELLRRLHQSRLDDADDLLGLLPELRLLDLAVAPVLEAVDLVLLLRRRVVLDRRPRALLLDLQGPERHSNITHLAPIFTPRIPNDPVLLVVLLAPADDTDDVVDRLQQPLVHRDARLIFEDGRRVDATRDG